MAIRKAKRSDLDALVAIEVRCFVSDRLSRRSLRYFLAAPNAGMVVAVVKGRVAGYALVSFHKRTDIARLYSIAIDPDFRGRELGLGLLRAAEKVARLRRARAMRLEVRERNRRAIALYERMGYRRFGRRENYYEDGATALRYEKPLMPDAKR